METLLPDGWSRPSGYSNGIQASGEMIFVAGQVGWNHDGVFTSDVLADQVRVALANIVAVLRAGGAGPRDVVRMNWYVTDVEEYRKEMKAIGRAYRDVMGSHYPAMTLVEVRSLAEPAAKVEIEATAVLENG